MKKITKATAVFAVFAVFLLTTGFFADKEANITLEINGTAVVPGQWFEVRFNAQSVSEVPYFEYRLVYNTAVFDHDNPTVGVTKVLDHDDYWEYRDDEDGSLKVMYTDGGGGDTPFVIGNGTRVATVRLKAAEGTPAGVYTLSLTGSYELMERDSFGSLRPELPNRTFEMEGSSVQVVIANADGTVPEELEEYLNPLPAKTTYALPMRPLEEYEQRAKEDITNLRNKW